MKRKIFTFLTAGSLAVMGLSFSGIANAAEANDLPNPPLKFNNGVCDKKEPIHLGVIMDNSGSMADYMDKNASAKETHYEVAAKGLNELFKSLKNEGLLSNGDLVFAPSSADDKGLEGKHWRDAATFDLSKGIPDENFYKQFKGSGSDGVQSTALRKANSGKKPFDLVLVVSDKGEPHDVDGYNEIKKQGTHFITMSVVSKDQEIDPYKDFDNIAGKEHTYKAGDAKKIATLIKDSITKSCEKAKPTPAKAMLHVSFVEGSTEVATTDFLDRKAGDKITPEIPTCERWSDCVYTGEPKEIVLKEGLNKTVVEVVATQKVSFDYVEGNKLVAKVDKNLKEGEKYDYVLPKCERENCSYAYKDDKKTSYVHKLQKDKVVVKIELVAKEYKLGEPLTQPALPVGKVPQEKVQEESKLPKTGVNTSPVALVGMLALVAGSAITALRRKSFNH